MIFVCITSFWNDCFNIQLSIIGILLTLFTVILSIIISKKDELRIYSEEIKNGFHSPEILQREKYLIRYIKNLKRANWILLYISAFIFIIFVYLWIFRLLYINNPIANNIAFGLMMLELCSFFVCTFLLVKWYINFLQR